MLLYLQKCLEHAAGVTEEDRVKNCILPPVGLYVDKLLTGVNTKGTSVFFLCLEFWIGLADTSTINSRYIVS